MNRLVLVVVAALAFSSAVGQEPTAPAQGQAFPGLPGVLIKIVPNSAGDVTQLLVFREGRQVQTLDVCTGKPIPGNTAELATADYDFDGTPDLALRAKRDKNGNDRYCVWLFDTRTQSFVPSPEVSRLTNPRPDPATRTIAAHKVAPCAGSCYENEVYGWSQGRLVPIRYEAVDEDPASPPTQNCRFIHTIKQEKNGRLLETQRNRVDQGGVRCVLQPSP